MKQIEDHLSKNLKRFLGKQIPVSKGPFILSKFTGVKPEVFIHAAEIIDFDGTMPDGSKTTRRPAQGPSTFKGYEEERPGRIILKVICISGTYSSLQQICALITPVIITFINTLPIIPLGGLPDKSTWLTFEDFNSNLHRAKLYHEVAEGISFYKGGLTFHLTGFIHLWVTKKGGFKSKSISRQKSQPPNLKSSSIKKPSGKK